MVNHNLLRWQPVKCRSRDGNLVDARLPDVIDLHYRGTLVSRMLAMPAQKPISFAAAINLIAEKQKEAFKAGKVGRESGHFHWYIENFVPYISSLGYHIELSGDEFESGAMPDKLA